jgi:hypothetical protein
MHRTVTSEDRWPTWAREQLRGAVELAWSAEPARPLARELYQRWFAPAPTVDDSPRPLLGEYRRAHAGVERRQDAGIAIIDHHDAIRGGWWRTSNTDWRPAQAGTRVLLSPRPDRAGELVGRLTWALRDVPYVLTAPIEPARLVASMLYLPSLTPLSPELVAELAPCLRPDTPPLCLPVAPGIAVAEYPDNGMTFGEHRCNLVALALGALHPARQGSELQAIADVFRAHGVDPSAPHRSARPL